MSRRRLLCCILSLLLALGLLLSGCGQEEAQQLDPARWKDWRIATPLAWSADYFLTTQGEVEELYRYDYMTDCLLALEYGYVDAIATDRLYAQYVTTVNPELVISEEAEVGPDQLVAFIANSRTDVRDQLNEFIPIFRASAEYADLQYRSRNFVDGEFVINNDIPIHQEGEKLIVAMDVGTGNYPYTFYDFKTRSAQGIDVEFIKRFAWDYGYVIEIFDSDWDSNSLALFNERVDVMATACSIYYQEEMDMSGYSLYSDAYFDLDLCLLVKKPTEINPTLIDPKR